MTGKLQGGNLQVNLFYEKDEIRFNKHQQAKFSDIQKRKEKKK